MSRTSDTRTSDRLAKALGASRRMTLPAGLGEGPLGLLALRQEVDARLRSSGGRPTDPEWTVRRVVPFRREGWTELELFAARLTESGRTVSPAQLAAILIERGLAALEDGVAQEGDAALKKVVG